ncbi:MAG: hypothetical protein ACOYEL_06920 [Saccharofermentanales bacterium]|jgi:hypothetical protein
MRNIGNPFVECTSRDMTFEEVFQYWCDPFECYGIDYSTLKKSTTPIIIEGPRGSGKTMILKYISYFCQKEVYLSKLEPDYDMSLLSYIRAEGSLGVYFRYRDDFGSLFKYLKCEKYTKEQLFLYYYELYVLDELFRVLIDIYDTDIQKTQNWDSLVQELNELWKSKIADLAGFSDMIKARILAVDKWIRRSRYLESTEKELNNLIDGDNFVQKVCRLIRNNIEVLSRAKILIIIDEYENASDYQHLLNTFVKQVDHTTGISYRIGVRPQGMLTLQTNVGQEFLQIDRDFLLYVLQNRMMTAYKKFAREIANRRLKSVPFFVENNIIDIVTLLGSIESFDDEAKMIVKNRRAKHFEILKRYLDLDQAKFSDIVSIIRNPDEPLMEMLNILWVLRGTEPKQVQTAMNCYINGLGDYENDVNVVKLTKKYKLDYSSKYRIQLLFSLLGIYGKKKMYYSFNTFSYLSSGAVNDFISLCRNTFYLLDESYYNDIAFSKLISADIQAEGAEKTAIEQMDKIQLCNENGTEMYSFAMNMGELFRYFHRDILARYPETNQFAFENETEVEQRPLLGAIKNSLVKWGVIVKRPRIQSISIGRRKGTLYYLNRIFSPLFGISYRTRGGYNFVIKTDLFEILLKNSLEPEKIMNWKVPEKSLTQSTEQKSSNDPKQISFDEVFGNEF